MEKLIKFLLTIIIIFLITNKVSAQKTNQKAIIKTTINCTHCNACETCGLRFKTEMLKIKGIKMYVLDETAMTFTVYFNSKKTDLPAIRQGISKLGYDADEIKADSSAYEKLDDCCKVL